jgi:hypothetical protein
MLSTRDRTTQNRGLSYELIQVTKSGIMLTSIAIFECEHALDPPVSRATGLARHDVQDERSILRDILSAIDLYLSIEGSYCRGGQRKQRSVGDSKRHIAGEWAETFVGGALRYHNLMVSRQVGPTRD